MTFNYTVSLTHAPSGQTVEIKQSVPAKYADSQVFLWEEGNYSCNCNRFLFFHRALGKTEEEIDELDPCKEDIGQCELYDDAGFVYRVDWIRNDATGEIIYEEREGLMRDG